MFDDAPPKLQTASDLFGNFRLQPKSGRRSERGDLLVYFYDRALPAWQGTSPLTIGYLALRLKRFSIPDLYRIKSNAEQEERRGEPWSKIFWGSIKSRDNN